MTEDELSPFAAPAERDLETSLRPADLHEFVGQQRVREQLELVLHGAMRRTLADNRRRREFDDDVDRHLVAGHVRPFLIDLRSL